MDKFAEAYISGYRGGLKKIGGVGSFLHDMFIDPVKGIWRDSLRGSDMLDKGQYMDATKAYGSLLGNTALTGFNIFGGLGSAALRGAGAGLRGLGWAAKGMRALPMAAKLTQGGEALAAGGKALSTLGHAAVTNAPVLEGATQPLISSAAGRGLARVFTGAMEERPMREVTKVVQPGMFQKAWNTIRGVAEPAEKVLQTVSEPVHSTFSAANMGRVTKNVAGLAGNMTLGATAGLGTPEGIDAPLPERAPAEMPPPAAPTMLPARSALPSAKPRLP